jgi:hypothetical protein
MKRAALKAANQLLVVWQSLSVTNSFQDPSQTLDIKLSTLELIIDLGIRTFHFIKYDGAGQGRGEI